MEWEPTVVGWLESVRDRLADAGVLDLVRTATVITWRANRERHEPEELFDDAFTLSMLSSHNLANRLHAAVTSDPRWASARVRARREHTTTVLQAAGFELRLVKAPHVSGRAPHFTHDFEWNSSDARLAAAARNAALCPLPVRQPDLSMLFDVPRPDLGPALHQCRDVFLVWGAEIETGLTAGWLGLPTTTADRWLGVVPVWWDAAVSAAVPLPAPVAADGPRAASVRLRARRQDGTAR